MRLKLDFDFDAHHDPNYVERYVIESEMVAKLKRAGFKSWKFSWKRSPSGQGWHCIVVLEPEPETPMEVVALQAILGSDPFREASNVLRARQLPKVPPFWRGRWNVLYRESSKRRLNRLRIPRRKGKEPHG